jgi:gliding motility-associated-like protein
MPVEPTVACYETATFNTTSCAWEVTGTMPVEPTVACYETANFNTTSCAWEVTGTMPVEPTVACYETANFNTTSCAWEVTGTMPVEPTVACYETATFNTTSCAWEVTGTMPVEPTVACYETATFNSTSCSWDISGTEPVPTYIQSETCNAAEFDPIDLASLLPSGTPTTGTWVNMISVNGLIGSVFNGWQILDGDYVFRYEITGGICPTIFDITINVNNDCAVLACQNIIVHNAFTPNGDGLNEYFFIENIDDITCYPTNSVEIYNRWGVLVYEAKNYDNNSIKFTGVSEGRATVSKSAELPAGTYFYMLQYTTAQGETISETKYLYLTR